MCGCRFLPQAGMPPPPHIKKAFDLKWYKVTRRAPEGQGTWVYAPPSPRPSPPLEKGGEGLGSGGMVRETF